MPRKEQYHRNKELYNRQAREWYHNNLPRSRETKRTYYSTHKEKFLERSKFHFHRLLQIWTKGIVNTRFNKKSFTEAEQFAIVDLEKYGFENVARLPERFSFDIVGELNGQKTVVDVTIGIVKNVRLKAKLSRQLGFPFYVLFVRPDLSFSYLMKCNKRVNLVIPRKVIYDLEKVH